MPKMLPALPQAFGNLKDVFRSAHESLTGLSNPLNLPKVKNALVIMVDGLGWDNLNSFAGHAPFIKKHMTKAAKGYSGFPSTTAASIVSLATGSSPSEHGFIGYRVFDRKINQSVNLLTGLDATNVSDYLAVAQVADGAENVVVVSRPEYFESGFSAATFGRAKFRGEADIAERFAVASEELNSGVGKLIYLYVPELDQTAHKLGAKSSKWIELLELIDSQVKALSASALKGRGVILTADHGIIDVPAENHIFLDECADLETDDLIDVGGDPRATFLYLAAGVDVQEKRSQISSWLGDRAEVLEVHDLIAAGFYSEQVLKFESILPDLVLLSGPKNACYHRRFAKPASLKMIGQHGGITESEITIPIIRLADYSSSLFVP